MDGCLERGRDLSQGLTYNNFGLHGACSANGADALAAVKTLVFEQEAIAPDDLLSALEQNFVGAEDLRAKLQHQAPKVGCGQEVADQMLTFLFDAFADACERYGDNGRGGRIRPGTGSAMYYVWLARGQEDMREPVVGATADGRHEGDFFSVNLAPSLGTAPTGPLSTFLSFCELDYNRICNGGPITIELSDTVFRGAESIRKVAMLVRSFAQLGCQQLQINSLDVATLLKARQNPDQYPNLIVRVWGWSGYFCELAPEYQDHILQRCMYQRAG
jgi:formate C-acetyltransferase